MVPSVFPASAGLSSPELELQVISHGMPATFQLGEIAAWVAAQGIAGRYHNKCPRAEAAALAASDWILFVGDESRRRAGLAAQCGGTVQ